MNDADAALNEFAALLAEDEGARKQVREGGITQGVVLEITGDSVLVDIGSKSEGRIDADEFRGRDGVLTIKAGDTVEVFVQSRENEHGQCVLSKREADRLKMWEQIATKVENDEVVRGTIINRVKGGLQVDIGVKAFLPGSQVELRPTRNLDKFIGQDFDFKIIKFNKKRGNIVLSRRALLEEEREKLKEKTLDKLIEGAIMLGQVKNITEYGAFVDLGGIDGLLHITDMSWGRVNHPEEVLAIGDEITVKILKFNPETERVSLGMKQLLPDPWAHADFRYPVSCQVLGRVVSLIDYGAFVELEEGIEGLIHISEMSWTQRVKHPSKVVEKGDIVACVVLKLDAEAKKISLGMKQLEPNPWSLLEERYPVGTRILGKIRNITDFGIFIGIEDGIDGLVHISDMSWTQKIKHPSEAFQKGDEVEAVVLNIDVENERFSLGIKQLAEDPWETLPERMPPGHVATATITKITDFGAFAEVEDGIEGLVHISELSTEHVDDPNDVVKPGDQVKVEVISVDPKERKIALSIKSYQQRAERGTLREYRDASETTLGDVLARHLAGKGE
ncbi:MAG: 30S ribosomal protein S1 [Myxococcales bacterium]|nr:30S ribosomal protein S1 [Myxococcales bacterium]MCB9520098.1 30S ribosomal protein S1 [Myxococcales bacterium]MCB9531824.1 30S ribosomal protein S1 [Myxococcales bacterium]